VVLKSRLDLEGRTFITIILNEGAQEKTEGMPSTGGRSKEYGELHVE
jgi:hypothetical protein